MVRRILCCLAAAAAVLAVSGPGPAVGAALKELSEGGITVSYPTGLEAQAKTVMGIAKEKISPSVGIHREIIALLSNTDAIGKHIGDLLGAEEKQDDSAVRLQGYKEKSQALVQCFSNIRLFKKADAVATDGVDAGVLQLRYAKDKDEFSLMMHLENADPSTLKRSYYPILVNTDGSVRAQDKLADIALDFLGSGRAMLVAPVHETVSYILTHELKLYRPMTRWFNEGISIWVTRQVIARANSKLTDITDQLFGVSSASTQLRGKVNLLAWPQAPYVNRNSARFDAALETAHTQYAAEAVANMLGKNGQQQLPKIMSEINYNSSADTDMICAAIKKVTGTDAKAALLAYVPPDIRSGIESNKAVDLTKEAEELVQKNDWANASEKLWLALQMTPGDINARLNLAVAERETGDDIDPEFQVFLLAALLKQGHQSIHLYDNTPEARYVLGRLAILEGDLQFAKQLLQSTLESKPDHKDAKRALEEIQKLEDQARGAGG